MKSGANSLFAALASALLGIGSCQAQEQPRSRDTAGYEDLRGSSPVPFQGRLWISEREIGGVLGPIERDGMIVVQSAFSATMFGLAWHASPVAVVTNTLELDCVTQKYRKLDEIWLSPEGAPLTRLEAANPQWQDGPQAAIRWACGDQTVLPVGPRFSSVAEFVNLYDAEAERLNLRPRVSGPTIARPTD